MERPNEKMRINMMGRVECISTAFARYMKEITILPIGYERLSAYRSLIMDGGRKAIISYPLLLKKVIESCGDALSEMQSFALAPTPGMATVSPEIFVGITPSPYVTLPSPYDPYDPVLIEATRDFVRTYLIPRWRERKFRGKPLILKDLGERGMNYYMVFGVIYTPRDLGVEKALFDIFRSAGREYAIRLLSAVTGGRVSVGTIRRMLMPEREEEEVVEKEEEAIERFRRIAELRRSVIEECVIPSLPVEWWIDVLSDYLRYINLMGALSEKDIRDLREKIRKKLLMGGERLSSAWQQWESSASTDLRLFQSVYLILDLLSSVDGFEELLNRMEFAMTKVRKRSLNIFMSPAEEGAENCVHALREILSSDELMDAFIHYTFYYPEEYG